MIGLGYSGGFKKFMINTAFNLFGYNKDTSLRSNLVQIETGEGKSITLAVTAIVLALLGFDVYCVCYSKLLSERDYLAFKPIFEFLSINENIFYDTFAKICEKTSNIKGDVRIIVNQIKNEILKSNKTESKNNDGESNKPRILLIDEVDVFLSTDFYGNSYNPMLNLTDLSIQDLILLIWKERKNRDLLDSILNSDEYRKCIDKYNDWKELIMEAIYEIISSLSTFQAVKYIVKDDKIAYKYQNDINFNINYRYNTILAYLHEHEKGNISDFSLENNLSILISLGSFSYPEIALQSFNSIIGVTGTLEHLNGTQKEIIKKDFLIEHQTYMPSIYGPNNLIFDPRSPKNFSIENEKNYFKIISMEIKFRIKVEKPVSVFVVFESISKLKRFYDSDAFLPLKSLSQILTDEANSMERKNVIAAATLVQKITLFTRSFCRGTDFIVHDDAINLNGGVHVIQTFLSEEYSEEVQIKSLTARKGDKGTFQLILSLPMLEKYMITPDELKKQAIDTHYQYLDRKRKAFFNIKYADNATFIEASKTKQSIKFFNDIIFSSDTSKIKNFLLKENKFGKIETQSFKTLILLDATGSMSHLLEKTKKTVQAVFESIAEFLENNNQNHKSFEIKIAVFRNYNSPEDKILQQSTWEKKPKNLLLFLKSIHEEGGWDNGAIEIGFFLANQEIDLFQIILIGASPANTRGEVRFKREHRSNIWKNSVLFRKPTYYIDELVKLKAKNIKVHTFYVAERARSNFEEIANFTNGKCVELDIQSNKGSKDLLNLIKMAN
jgi:hypothetical protein